MTTITDTRDIEMLMRLRLDGTFTRLNAEGRVVTLQVPVDYEPTHGFTENAPRRTTGMNSRRWTPEEDAELMERRRKGTSLAVIAEDLGRTEESVRKRAQTIRAWILKRNWEAMKR